MLSYIFLINSQILHTPTFRAELTEFFSLEPEAQRVESDPAWVALLLLVSALDLSIINL